MTVLRTLGVCTAYLGALALLYALGRILLLVAIAGFVAFLLVPAVGLADRLLRRVLPPARVTRGLSVGAVYVALLGAGVAVFALLAFRVSRQLGQLSGSFPRIAEKLQLNHWTNYYQARPMPAGLRLALDRAGLEAVPVLERWLDGVAAQLLSALQYLPWFALVPLLSLLFLINGPALHRLALALLPEGRARWRTQELFAELASLLASYARGQVVASLFTSLCVGTIAVLNGIPFPLVVGLFAGVLEFVPMVGPAIVLVGVGLTAGFTGHLLTTLVALLCLRLFTDNVFYPRLYRRGLKLPALAVTLALLCGSQLAGAVGLFLAIPFVAVGTVVLRHVRRYREPGHHMSGLLHSEEPQSVPAIEGARDAPEALGRRSHLLNGRKVLIVDNDGDARELLGIVLESEGVVVFTARSSEEALEVLRVKRPDLLVSDIGMPGGDGLELIARIRALPAGLGQVPAIALTGYASDEDRHRVLGAGFQRHLTKPVSPARLLLEVEGLLQRTAPGPDRGETGISRGAERIIA